MDFYEMNWLKWSDMKQYGPSSRHLRRLIFNIIKNLNFNSVMDIGCGEGSFLKELFFLRQGIDVIGIDISSNAISLAKKKISNGIFKVLNAEKEIIDLKADLVVCCDVIEHIVNDQFVINNLAYASNRYILISTLQGQMRDIEKDVGHVRNYSKEDLFNKFKNAGISIVKVLEWGFPFYSPLYRNILSVPKINKLTYGKFNLLQRIAAYLIYFIFYLNSYKKGDYLIILGEVNR